MAATLLAALATTACTSVPKDPVATIGDKNASYRQQLLAIDMIEAEGPPSEEALKQLHRAVWVAGYSQEVRERAVEVLYEDDREALQRTIRQQLPRMTDHNWMEALCAFIADHQMIELNPALVSSWARPSARWRVETERPEYLALASMNGADNVDQIVFDLLIKSNRVSDQGLRIRCWELLHRLGYRAELIEMVAGSSPDSGDGMMIDLRAAAVDFGTVPHNREEILWVRKLRQPERAGFWEEARLAVAAVPAERRGELEIRDLPVVVAAYRHRPDLLTESEAVMAQRIRAALENERHYFEESRGGMGGALPELMSTHRDKLDWGDLAAIELAMQALEVPQVRSHLFDYALRDRLDETTEYGGVIALDEQGRYEVLEFIPRVHEHDLRFNAPQQMFDAGYTSLYHFHFHATRERNGDHAGPGLGDLNYADNTRANCLVLTSLDADRMNVDYYRHGRVVVDLGVVDKPSG